MGNEDRGKDKSLDMHKNIESGMGQLPRRIAILFIRMYQSTASMRPAVCRYRPTCSEYTAQCVAKYGVFAGVALGIRRILRCNPLSTGGYDPVPRSVSWISRKSS